MRKISFFIVFCLVSAICVAKTKKNEIPIEYFIKQGDYLDLQISPDGKRFAARARVDDRVVLVFIDAKTNKPTGLIKPGNLVSEIYNVQWVNDERVVYELAIRGRQLDKPLPTGELFAVNYDESQHEILYGVRADDSKLGSRISHKEARYASQEVLNNLDADEEHILILEHPWTKIKGEWWNLRKMKPTVSKLDIYSGNLTAIEEIPFPGADVLTDREGKVRFARWIDKGGVNHAAYKDTSTNEWAELSYQSDQPPMPGDLLPIGMNTFTDELYLQGSYGEQEFENIFSMDLKTEVIKPVFENIKSDLVEFETDFKTGQPISASTGPGIYKHYYANSESGDINLLKMLVKAFAGQNISIVNRTKDGRKIVVKVTSDVNPGEFYVFDRDTKSADLAWINKSWIDPRLMKPVDPITFKSRDGLELNGYVTKPHKESKSLPMVVFVHGGPHGVMDEWAFNNEVQLLASRGYAVLQINYRGSWGYGRVFQQLGYKEWGGKIINDIVDGTKWAIDKKIADKNKICIFGASFGGYAALMAAALEPKLYKCAIGYSGIYDLSEFIDNTDIVNSWGGKAYLERVVGNEENVLKAFSPITYVDQIKADVLLVHGQEDLRTPIKSAKKMTKSLKKAKKKVKFLEYGKAGHGVWDEGDQIKLYKNILDFISESLGKT